MTARGARLGALLILCAHLVLSHSHNYLVGPDDDRLWLYATAASEGRRDRAQQLTHDVRASMVASKASEVRLFRFDTRANYDRNYVGMSWLHRAGQELAHAFTGDLRTRDYPAYASRAMISAYALAYAVIVLLFVAALLIAKDERLTYAACLTVTVVAVLEVLFDMGGDVFAGLPNLLPEAASSETVNDVFWRNLMAMLANPQVGFSPFGDNPRNHILLLTIPLFLLRWSGRHAASYLFLLLLGFVHQSMTGLLFAYLVLTDAILRPGLFLTRAAPLMLLICAMFVSRESLGSVVGMTGAVTVALVVAVLAAAAGGLWLLASGHVPILSGWQTRLQHRLLGQGPATADVVVLFALWTLSLPVAFIVNSHVTRIQSVFFWAQLHGRMLALLRPALFTALSLYLINRWARSGESRARQLTLAAMLVGLGPSLYWATQHGWHPLHRIEAGFRTLDRRVGPQADWSAIDTTSEPGIYYLIGRELELDSVR